MVPLAGLVVGPLGERAIMHTITKGRWRQRHRSGRTPGKALRLALAVLVTAPPMAITTVVVTAPSPALAAEDFLNILPGDDFSVTPPDCGSVNIEGEGNMANWRFRTTIGSGSTVFVGQQIVVKAGMYDYIQSSANGNDGPDPLILELPPTGPVKPGAPIVGSEADYSVLDSFKGSGSTGPIAPVGDWGYKFDANSSPTYLEGSTDGTDEMITITLEATGPGEISIKQFKVSGHDGTPIAGAVKCAVDLNWYWEVIEMQDPVAKLDFATTDASYEPAVTGDATTGRHGVWVDVLANDDDPNENFGCDGFCGIDPDPDVRIASWDATRLDCGDESLNGKTPTAVNFDGLATGPCLYTPQAGAENWDEVGYTMIQRSGLRTADSSVLVTIENNQAPTINDAEGELTAGDPYVMQLGGFVDDFDGDPTACVPASLEVDQVIDTLVVSLDANCQLSWSTGPAANYVGPVVVSYRACDLHATLTDAELGDERGPNYSKHLSDPAKNDFANGSTRRCATGTLTFDFQAPGPMLAPPFQAINDYDVLDHAYTSDGIGPFSLDVDVADNDVSFNVATNVNVNLTLGNGGYAPSQADIKDLGDRIQVTSTNMSPLKLTIAYRICGTFQNVGVRCATAKLIVDVKRNLEPVAVDDLFGVTPKTPQIRQVAANDFDPEGAGALTCSTSNHPWGPVGAFDSVAVSSDCNISFDAASGFTGDAFIEYQVCDNHHLANPGSPAIPYGIFAAPGQLASRCAPALARFTFKNFVISLPPPVAVVPNVPVCNADAFQTTVDTKMIVDVLANDTDLGQDNLPGALTLPLPENTVTSQGGALNAIANKLQYLPKPGFVGVDTGVYNVLDSDGNGCAANVTFTVLADVVPPNPPQGGTLPETGSTTGPTTALAIATLLLGLCLVVIGRGVKRQVVRR